MKEENSEKEKYVEIWEDNVHIKDLLVAMALCIGFALGGYLFAFGDTPPLIFGLAGGVIGFIISSIIIKPKRQLTVMEEGEDEWTQS
jgi:glycopeptide antibiotics resistance protein